MSASAFRVGTTRIQRFKRGLWSVMPHGFAPFLVYGSRRDAIASARASEASIRSYRNT